MKHRNLQSGIAILASLLLAGIMISIMLVLMAIFIPKIRVASDVKNSTAAVYAAESALEWCLYIDRVDDTAPRPVMSNGATFEVSDCKVKPVKATGTYRGISRAFEIGF